MDVDITPLREIAPVFSKLGDEIVASELLEENITFGQELIATGEYFRKLASYLDPDDYTSRELEELLDNLYRCQTVTIAGANIRWSNDEQLQAVDRAAEKLNFGLQCRSASDRIQLVIDRLHSS